MREPYEFQACEPDQSAASLSVNREKGQQSQFYDWATRYKLKLHKRFFNTFFC